MLTNLNGKVHNGYENIRIIKWKVCTLYVMSETYLLWFLLSTLTMRDELFIIVKQMEIFLSCANGKLIHIFD